VIVMGIDEVCRSDHPPFSATCLSFLYNDKNDETRNPLKSHTPSLSLPLPFDQSLTPTTLLWRF
jgi:hypothetical protein